MKLKKNEMKKFLDNLNILIEKCSELDLSKESSWNKIINNFEILLTNTKTTDEEINKLMRDIVSQTLDYFERKEKLD